MVSVIIPVYNREKVVVDAVNSVLNQTYTDLELIVVDDGSTDNTKKVLSQISDKRLKYVYQENAGACVARNHGIELAKGSYIAFHDSDDIWHLDKLEKQMAVFNKYNPDIVFCKLHYKKKNGTEVLWPENLKGGYVDPIENLFQIGTQTIIGKKEIFKKIRFDKELPRFQEFEFLYRASKEYSLYCLDEGLVEYSIGEDSISGNPEKLYKACCLIISKHPELISDYPEMARLMAHSLQVAGNRVKESGKGDYKKYLELSLSCHKDLKLLLKSIIIRMGLYGYLHK